MSRGGFTGKYPNLVKEEKHPNLVNEEKHPNLVKEEKHPDLVKAGGCGMDVWA